MSVENRIPGDLGEIVDKARRDTVAAYVQEQVERAAQESVDKAFSQAVAVLEQGELIGKNLPTSAPKRVEKRRSEPVVTEQGEIRLEGELTKRKSSRQIEEATLAVVIVFPQAPDIPKGKEVELFTASGKINVDDSAEYSKLFTNGKEITDPTLKLRYSKGLQLLTTAISKPGAPPVQK